MLDQSLLRRFLERDSRYEEVPQTQIQLDLLRFYCLEHRGNPPNRNGYTRLHRLVQDELTNKWELYISKLLPSAKLAPFYRPWSVLEVKLELREGRNVRRLVTDVLGVDAYGRVALFEVSTTHKKDDLIRQLRAIKSMFPLIDPYGFTLMYQPNLKKIDWCQHQI